MAGQTSAYPISPQAPHDMLTQLLNIDHHNQLVDLFTTVFTASEGDAEGAAIGQLASQLCLAIDQQGVLCMGTVDNNNLLAAICLTRLTYSTPIEVYMLSPVAVATRLQGQGLGQALIAHGLAELTTRGVEVVVTYGDPAFYGKCGFEPLSTSVLDAPRPLSMPQGWLGQSLNNTPIPTVKGAPSCIAAFNNASYW